MYAEICPDFCFLYLIFLPNIRIQVVGFLENSFSVFLFLVSCDRSRVPFCSSLDLTDDDDHYFTQYLAERLDEMSVRRARPRLF